MSGPNAPDVNPDAYPGRAGTELEALARVLAHLRAAQAAAVDYCDRVREHAETRVADVLDDPAYDEAIGLWSVVTDALTKVARTS